MKPTITQLEQFITYLQTIEFINEFKKHFNMAKEDLDSLEPDEAENELKDLNLDDIQAISAYYEYEYNDEGGSDPWVEEITLHLNDNTEIRLGYDYDDIICNFANSWTDLFEKIGKISLTQPVEPFNLKIMENV